MASSEAGMGFEFPYTGTLYDNKAPAVPTEALAMNFLLLKFFIVMT